MNDRFNIGSTDKVMDLCLELQSEVSRFIVVEQNLINAKNSVDRELSRFRMIQRFSELAQKEQDLLALGKLCVESVVEIFEVECSCLLKVESQDLARVISCHGLNLTRDTVPFSSSWFGNRSDAVLVKEGAPLLVHWSELNLHRVLVFPLVCLSDKIDMVLFAGVTIESADFYDPIEEGVISSFSVLSRQVQNTYQSIQTHDLIQRQMDELRELDREKDRANQLKDDFLATLSHELRTPLNVIHGNVEVLLEDFSKMEKSQVLSSLLAIQRNAKYQTHIISDLLDVSRIVSGKLSFQPCPIDPQEILSVTATSLCQMAEEKDIKIEVDIDPGSPAEILADPTRLQQIVWNLISNAIKFTPAGGQVHLKAQQEGRYYAIRVCDSGLGIDPSFLPHVFDRFKQEDSGTARRFGGLGLGLSIVRHLTELHGGHVEAFSDGKGTGSEFKVRLPLTLKEEIIGESANMTYQPLSNSELSQKLTGKRVLLIDDSVDSCRITAIMLTKAGAEVEEVHSAQQAREKLATYTPDVIVSDIGMPEENGITFMQGLRASEREGGRHLPGVALTAYARPDEVEQILAAGFQAHVSKPVCRIQLVHAILSAIT